MISLATIAGPFQEKEKTINVMSYNIRYDNPGDSGNLWVNRREIIQQLISYHNPDLLGTQEGLFHQLNYLKDNLPDYDWVGKARDDGAQAGEFSAVFYKKSRFDLLDQRTFWLSTTPEKPSKAWDAALPRVATWVKLMDKENKSEIFFFNTHFDHRGSKARLESSKVLIQQIKNIAGNAPVILSGDFNLSENEAPYPILTGTGLKDALKISETPHYGPLGSFNSFNWNSDPDRRIDYIFVNEHFSVEQHAILTDSYRKKYPSDHFPVIAVVQLK